MSKLCGLSGHGLLAPVRHVLGELSEKECRLLAKLEQHVLWAGKYTIPMLADVLFNKEQMDVLRNSPMNEFELLESIVNRLFAMVPSEPRRFR